MDMVGVRKGRTWAVSFSVIVIGLICSNSYAGIGKWTGNGPEGGIAQSVAFSSDGLTAFVGGQGGIWKSVDAGATWERLPVTFRNSGAHLAVDPSDPNNLYFANSSSVYRVKLDTATLIEREVRSQEYVSAFAISADGLYVANSSGNFYYSPDNGITWYPRSTGLPSDPQIDSLHAGATGVVYALMGLPAQVWRSDDSGESWSDVSPTDGHYLISMVVDQMNAGRVFVSGDSGIHRSENGGASWSKVHEYYVSKLAIAPSDPSVLYAVGRSAIYKSTDAGLTWTLLSPLPEIGEAQSIAVNPVDPNNVVLTTSRGILHSTNGTDFSLSSTGYLNSHVLDIAFDPSNGSRILAGVAYNAISLSNDGGDSWTSLARAPLKADSIGHTVAISPADSKRFLVSDLSGIRRSIDSGANWGTTFTEAPVRHIRFSPANANVAYAALMALFVRMMEAITGYELISEFVVKVYEPLCQVRTAKT